MDRDAAARRSVLTARARGSRDHYADPVYYEQAYRSRADDVAFYVERARRSGGPALEYGIGSGRVAIPVARAGVSVVGVDHSRPMLRALRERLAREPAEVRARVRARRGDMRSARLGRRFPLVLAPFNVLLHLYTRADVDRFFARAKEHLAPGGRLVCDLTTPCLEDLARPPDRPFGLPPFRHPRFGVVRYEEYFDYDRAAQVLFVRMRFRPKRGGVFETLLAHRQFFPAEWEALMHHGGFEIEERFGDYRGAAFGPESEEMVIVARKRRR